MQCEGFFQRWAHLAQTMGARAIIGVIAQCIVRNAGDLIAVSQRQNELIGAIIETDNAARRGRRRQSQHQHKRTGARNTPHQHLLMAPSRAKVRDRQVFWLRGS